MRNLWIIGMALSFNLVLSFAVQAQSVEVDDGGGTENTKVSEPSSSSQGGGKAKADQYFKHRSEDKARPADPPAGALPHYLALHLGTFFTDQHYDWGDGQNNIHNLNAGVTYRIGEWVNSMDLNVRIEYTNFVFATNSAKMLSFSGLITFPDANSHFPLYIGAGVGPGLFIQQVPDRSPVALDWQVVGGVRVMNLVEHMGFMVESGIKNHILIASPGQFNGVFVNVGTVFAF